MEFRTIKKTGDHVSILGFGCMRLASSFGRIDEVKAEAQLRHAIKEGVNYIDTAYPYHMGESEKFLGRVFQDRELRDKVKIATKLPPWLVKNREDMESILNEQLSRLQMDSIDYYLVHSIIDQKNWDRLKSIGVLEFLKDAKSAGKIKHIGFSAHCDLETFRNVVDDFDWEICQIQYNLLDENNQAGTEGLKYAAERDISVIIMEPLRGGNLSNKVPKSVQQLWSTSPIKRSPAEWAMRWIWNHPEVTCVLSGMNQDEHIKENIKATENATPGHLGADEIKLVERVRDKYKELTKVPCTACGYCMPCPAGVNIPECFSKYNDIYMFGKMSARMMYMLNLGGVTGGTPAQASLCVGCGKCEHHCPQHIEIRKELKKVSSEFDDIAGKLLFQVGKAVMGRRKKK